MKILSVLAVALSACAIVFASFVWRQLEQLEGRYLTAGKETVEARFLHDNRLNSADVRIEHLERAVKVAGIDGLDVASAIFRLTNLIALLDQRLTGAESQIGSPDGTSADELFSLRWALDEAKADAKKRAESLEWDFRFRLSGLEEKSGDRLKAVERKLASDLADLDFRLSLVELRRR